MLLLLLLLLSVELRPRKSTPIVHRYDAHANGLLAMQLYSALYVFGRNVASDMNLVNVRES